MKIGREPKDKYTPFYALKFSKLPVPDPQTAVTDELQIPAYFTEREPFFKGGKPATLLRFKAQMITFRRLVDEEGNAAWAYPIDLPKQNARMN